MPRFVFGTRNVVVELRVAGLVLGSTEVVVGTLGVVSGRALRTASLAAAGPALVRAVVGALVIGAPPTDAAATSPSESRRRRS